MRRTNNKNKKIKVEYPINVSTYMASYKVFQDVQAERFRQKRDSMENQEFKPKPRTHLDLETFTPLKRPIPISLMPVPNDITGRNPLSPVQHIEIPEDGKKAEVIKTRPRLFKSPQVSLDEVHDPDMRKMIVDYTYTSHLKRTEQDLLDLIWDEYKKMPEIVAEPDKLSTASRKPYFGVYFDPKPLLRIKMTSEQNSRGRQWENERTIGTSNSTQHFWKHNQPKYGPAYTDLVGKDTKDKINDLVTNDKLQIQHDKTCLEYGGFKSSVPVGIDLAKRDFPRNHPFRSTYQEAFSWKIGCAER
ncbi:uncharacterized protein LOC123312249 [Coccinella septempunctata]|uniref:uncharacterized protein LOC123312249 n=1 Tax=Coccinella septempunctata TaxID=41139 RepID=UPI001D06E6A6|nr:uncharacterized protein LOC123312249 [Coccinella septempunctata]